MNEFNQEEMDEKIMSDIRKRTEDLEIPESLKPENMMDRIKRENKKKKKLYSRIRVATSVLAASLAVVVGVVSFRTISKGKGDTGTEPDKAIEKQVLSFNNYDEIYELLNNEDFRDEIYFNTMTDGVVMDEVEGSANDMGSLENKGEQQESQDYTDTNIQVEGVDEADIIKTDGKNIFVYDSTNNIVRIIKADGEKTEVISQINISTNEEDVYYGSDMYLYDEKLVILYSDNYWNGNSIINTYDVSDVLNPKKIGEVKQEGEIHSSRMVDGMLYVFSTKGVPYDLNEDDEFVPLINENAVECKDIYKCGTYYDAFTTMISVDINKPDIVKDVKSVLTYGSYIYVSKNNIYIMANGTKETSYHVNYVTDIFKIEYKDGVFNPIAEGQVDGKIRDQFSIDEYEGTLRVLTTSTGYSNYPNNMWGNIAEEVFVENYDTSNNVFVLDSSLNIMGSITNLAPGERIYSARFDGDMGYFVTFRETDPVFAVDFSDKKNPKILGELKVSGFSEYLHMWSDNLMIGIGEEVDENTGEQLGIKISMFDVTDPENMVEVDKVVVQGQYSQVLYNHKALLINPEKNLIGFDVDYDDWMAEESTFTNSYCIFSYDEEIGFVENVKKQYVYTYDDMDYNDILRGVHIGDYVYIINTDKEINIYDINSKEITAKIKF